MTDLLQCMRKFSTFYGGSEKLTSPSPPPPPPHARKNTLPRILIIFQHSPFNTNLPHLPLRRGSRNYGYIIAKYYAKIQHIIGCQNFRSAKSDFFFCDLRLLVLVGMYLLT